jgi:hypothetical protein
MTYYRSRFQGMRMFRNDFYLFSQPINSIILNLNISLGFAA